MRDPVLVAHPKNVDKLREIVGRLEDLDVPGITGMPIVADPLVPRYAMKYEPPTEQFWEYDESDYEWLQYFGFGRWVETGELVYYVIDRAALWTVGSAHHRFPDVYMEHASVRWTKPDRIMSVGP